MPNYREYQHIPQVVSKDFLADRAERNCWGMAMVFNNFQWAGKVLESWVLSWIF